jgi:hypothetical protein
MSIEVREYTICSMTLQTISQFINYRWFDRIMLRDWHKVKGGRWAGKIIYLVTHPLIAAQKFVAHP